MIHQKVHKLETVVFYNVENLFLPFNSNVASNRHSAFGVAGWNVDKYKSKIEKIAHVIELLKIENSVMPMLIGLAEVEGLKPLQDLIATEHFREVFGIVHYESMDERGVDVALIYDKTKLTVKDSEPLTYFFDIDDDNPENYDTTRDVLYCKMAYQNLTLHIFVLHLPSKRDNDINEHKRNYILNNLKKRIETLQSSNTDFVLIMGDFNENPSDKNIANLLNQKETPLFNPFIDLFQNKHYSTFHYKDGLLFDQMILSENFKSPQSKIKFSEARIFNPIKISNWNKRFAGRPFRTYAGSRYLGGYSDHFPIYTKFQINS